MGVISLKEQCYFLQKSNSERKDYMNDKFSPQFIRYIGIFEDYESSLKTLKIMSIEEKNKWLFFENEIPLDQDLDFFEKIRNKVEELRGKNFVNSNLIIFNNEEVNEIFLKSVDYISELIINNDDISAYKSYDLISMIICLGRQHLTRKKFDYISNIKCIYFGKIDRVNIYFLMLLYRMMIDVIYINPSDTDEFLFEEIDYDMLSTLVKSDKIINDVNKYTLDYIAKKGIELRRIKSTASYVQENVYNNLYNKEMIENNVFRANQFLDYKIVPILFDGVVADLYHSFISESRFREGFKINEESKILYMPHFFTEIQGVNEDSEEYKKMVNHILSQKETICFTNEDLWRVVNEVEKEKINIEDKELGIQYKIEKDLYFINKSVYRRRNFYFSELAFTRNEDDTFNLEDIKKVSFYKFRKLKDTTIKYIFGKINEIFQMPFLFKKELNFEKKVRLLFLIFLLNDFIIQMLENFDFTNKVPKIVIFLTKDEVINEDTGYILTILALFGLDIIILTPNGKSGIDEYINNNLYSQIILEKTEKLELKELLYNRNVSKEGFLSVLFKWKK